MISSSSVLGVDDDDESCDFLALILPGFHALGSEESNFSGPDEEELFLLEESERTILGSLEAGGGGGIMRGPNKPNAPPPLELRMEAPYKPPPPPFLELCRDSGGISPLGEPSGSPL